MIKQHGRLLCAGRWLGLLAILTILAMFAYSSRRSIIWINSSDSMSISLKLGTINLVVLRHVPVPPTRKLMSPGWHCALIGGDPPIVWWPRTFDSEYGGETVVPLWILLSTVTPPTAWLWYRDRRRIRDHLGKIARRVAPTKKVRLSWRMYAFFLLLHVVALYVAENIVVAIGNHLDLWTIRGYFAKCTDAMSAMMFQGSPLLAFVWATLYVAVRNRLRKRFYPLTCHTCGYTLTGNVSGRCPECGRVIESDQGNSEHGE